MSCSRVLMVGLLLCWSSASARGPQVGAPAPLFELETLKGRKVHTRSLKGRPTVMVVARTRAAAEACKGWVDAVREHLAPRVAYFQVIVALKPWYLPEFAVRGKVEQLVPAEYHPQVLIEWRDRFARQFDIPKDRKPTVLVLDSQGILRWKHRGALTPDALARLRAALPRELSALTDS